MREVKVLSHETLSQLHTACEMQEQQLLSAICDVCVYPFRAANQDTLDEQCERCPVIALTQSALRKRYACGYTQGMYDACSSIRDAYAAVNQEINERYRR